MKNKILILSIVFFIQGCKTNNDSITGKYFNHYEKDVIHYVELKKDSTFFHLYKKRGEDLKVNRGFWKSKIDKGDLEILFKTWTNFGHNNLPPCNGCFFYVKLENNELLFNTDLPKESNFIKE